MAWTRLSEPIYVRGGRHKGTHHLETTCRKGYRPRNLVAAEDFSRVWSARSSAHAHPSTHNAYKARSIVLCSC